MRGYDVPVPVLIHWYECGRKVKFTSEEEARRLRAWQQHFYLCPHGDGDHWHTGRKPVVRMKMKPADARARERKAARKEWDKTAYQNADWAYQRWHQDGLDE